MDYSDIRGFNYQPSYGSTSFENWLYFDKEIIELELRRGKDYFPVMNTIRLWLSWKAFTRSPEKFAENFNTALNIAEELDLQVIPILFNRWHDKVCDCGGIYIDHIMPSWSWVYKDALFQKYLDVIVGKHKTDERILIWDICNEPFAYQKPISEMKDIEKVEFEWLEKMYKTIKEYGVKAPVGISIHPGHGLYGIKRIEPISDVLMVHPYYVHDQDDIAAKEEYFKLLDNYIEFKEKTGKPMFVTETCWGSLDDAWRIENIHFTLSELKKRNLGWVVHALHHSLVADLHRPQYGPVGDPGYLAFIEADGSLREGHEIFNQY